MMQFKIGHKYKVINYAFCPEVVGQIVTYVGKVDSLGDLEYDKFELENSIQDNFNEETLEYIHGYKGSYEQGDVILEEVSNFPEIEENYNI